MPVSSTFKPWARASQPTIVVISWMRVRVSLALVEAERSWLSLARRHGCEEMWMFAMVVVWIAANLK